MAADLLDRLEQRDPVDLVGPGKPADLANLVQILNQVGSDLVPPL